MIRSKLRNGTQVKLENYCEVEIPYTRLNPDLWTKLEGAI